MGAPDFDAGEPDEGRAFLWLGAADGLSAPADWTAEANHPGARFGASLAGAGDVDGDGYDDVLVGAPGYEDVGVPGGRAYLFHGSPAGLAGTAAWTASGVATGDGFGTAVASAGDVDGDGFADAIVGVPGHDVTSDEGRVSLFFGSAAGLAATAGWSAEGSGAGAALGSAVASAGDVNADGFADVLAGAPGFNGGLSEEGGAFVWHGGSAGPSLAPDWSATGGQADAHFGAAVGSGDANGDGASDVVVGAPDFDDTLAGEGRAWLYPGSPAGLALVATWSVDGDQTDAALGTAVAGIGDVNGDGYGELLVGAPGRSLGQANEGQAFAFLGSATGPSLVPDWDWEGNSPGARLGEAVAGAGDLEGDGYADAVVGTPNFQLTQAEEGGMVVFSGNDAAGGLAGGILQRRTDGSAPVAPVARGGRSDAADAFVVRAALDALVGLSWSAPGATTVWLEWEVKPVGVPFDGTGLARSSLGQVLAAGALPLVFEDEVLRADPAAATETWRARFATDDPLAPVTPWFTLGGGAPSEVRLSFPDGGRPRVFRDLGGAVPR